MTEIDKRMRAEFPHKFSEGGEAESNRQNTANCSACWQKW